MKLKRFLALAVSLAMVLTMVPAFSLTASAAEETVLFDVDNITTTGEQTLDVAGWTATESGAAARWNQNWGAEGTGVWGSTGTYALMFFFSNKRQAGDGNVTATIDSAANTKGATKVTVDFNFATQECGNIYQTWTYLDADGNEYARLAFDRNNTVRLGNGDVAAHSGSGTSAVYGFRGTNIKIETVKNTSDYTINYYVAGELLTSETVANANGFGGVKSFHGTWNDQYSAAGMQDLRITYELPATTAFVTATYTLNGETIKTVENSYDTATESGAAFDTVYHAVNGSNNIYTAEATTLSEDTTIELEAITNVGTHAVGDIVAVNGVQYEVKSANLIPNADFALGTVGWFGGDGNQLGASVSNGAVTLGNIGGGNNKSLNQSWAIEAEKTYLYTYNTTSGGNTWHITSLQNAVKCDENTTGAPVLVGKTNNGTYVGTLATSDATGTNNFVFTNTDGYAYLQSAFRWTGATFSNFGLYEIAEAETVVAEEIASVADIAPVKVIGDTAVVLPTTVEVTGSLGSTATGTITWTDAPESYEVGETTVNGTVSVKFTEDGEALTQAVSTTVTVLEETFTLADLTSGGTDNVSYFPIALSGEFTLQFDMTASNYDNLWIYIGANGALWGAGQIGLGWDANETGYFRAQPAAHTNVQFATGNNYRFFVTGSAATDTYDLMVVDLATNTVIATADDYGFRTGSDVVNAIVFTPNGENGVGTMSNIKVNAPGVSKTEYTFNITMDGETSTKTASYWTVEEAQASVADIEGYEKAVTVEGTTINVVYSATQTLAATFVDANENVIKAVSEVVALGETVTVPAEEIFFLDGDYNGYFYQIPETVISADNNNLVITVSETANKYAVMEDMLVSDNEVWGMKATNNNSVFVAAGADANRGALDDANGVAVTDGSHTPSTLGKSRVGFMQFPVVDVTEGQKVTANFYVRTWHAQTFDNGNSSIRFTVTGINDTSWTALSDGGSYDSANAPVFEGYANPVFSPACYNNTGYVAVDITEMMMAAKAAGLETITLRLNIAWGAAYIAEREACVVGGAYAGNASYLLVEDAGLVKVTETGSATLTKNGSDVNGVAYVAATDDVRLVADGAVVVGTDGTDAGYYYNNTAMSITEATAFENTVPASLGLAIVNGAQVRVGDGVDENGKIAAGSGLRFLATADYTDTVIADANVEFGLKVTAEGSTEEAFVPGAIFQNDEENVFTVAITNLNVTNYNRNYTAVPYAKVTMADGTVATFLGDTSVTRSIYQVSAGIMQNGTADDQYANTVDATVEAVLNAYVNMTGIRLSVTADGVAVEDNKYTGAVFFTVESVSDGDDGFNVTITPDTTWGTPAEIAQWWTDYVRFNNNNGVAKGYISNAAFADGVLTFNFDTTADETVAE
ncbi:MAG: hypothetical protein IJ316_04160 [Clostridia bacterium]|nr:hypothetical protein [Clostridia bacterium]